MNKVKIAGAGLTGLTLSYLLENQGVPSEIFEKSDRIGGFLRTVQEEGFVFEMGPRGFRPKGKGLLTLELIRSLGLENDLVTPDPSASKRYLYYKGKLEPFPYSLASFLSSKLTRPLIKGMLKDFFTKKKDVPDETIDDFFTRRMGKEFSDIFADSLCSGIYAGDKSKIDKRKAFPDLKEPVYKNFFKSSKQNEKWSRYPLLSLKGGMGSLIEALKKNISAPIYLNNPLYEGISCFPQSEIPKASVIVVHAGYFSQKLDIKAFGYLVPKCENQSILGVIFDSASFPMAHEEGTRLTLMMGGSLFPEQMLLPDDEIKAIAFDHITRHLGLHGYPDYFKVHKLHDAIPQPCTSFEFDGPGVNDAVFRAEQICNFKVRKLNL